MTQVDFSSMSAVQLRSYAKDELGISYPAKMKKAEIIAKIKENLGSENQIPEPIGAGAATDGNEEKVPVAYIINIQDDGDRLNYVALNAGGRNYQIQKGVDARVPPSVYHALKDAIEKVPVKERDHESGKTLVNMRPRARFPFSVLETIY